MRVAAGGAAARGGPGRAAAKPSTRPTTPPRRDARMATRAVVAHGAATRTPVRVRRADVREGEQELPRQGADQTEVAGASVERGGERGRSSEELELKWALPSSGRGPCVRQCSGRGRGRRAPRLRPSRRARRKAQERRGRADGTSSWVASAARRRRRTRRSDRARGRSEGGLETYGHGRFVPPPRPSPRGSTSRRALLKAPATTRGDAACRRRGRVARRPRARERGLVRQAGQPLGFNLTTDKRGAYAQRCWNVARLRRRSRRLRGRWPTRFPPPPTADPRGAVPNEIEVTQFPFSLGARRCTSTSATGRGARGGGEREPSLSSAAAADV